MNARIAALIALTLSPAMAAEIEPALAVENLWIREAPPVARVLAGYGRFCNEGNEAVILAGVTSPSFSSVEMHETIETESRASMRRLEQVAIDPNDCVDFAPGGRHFMLFNPETPLRAGTEVRLTLSFANGLEQEIIAPVRRQQDNDTHGSHSHEH